MRWLTIWAATAVGLAVISHIHLGITASSAQAILVAALVLGLVNTFIRPIVKLLTLPINLLTFGLFGLVINAFMLWLVSSVVPGFAVSGFGAAFWGAILLSIISGVVGWIIRYL
ncbi:MAG: phage holin family protein [Firmicutes bacterium]|jgi:putative membrane protein|nr:phage holin family protein [Bacillota bacterium]MCL5015729.1 phage holin family protein [Bacillota bacterium]